MSLVTVKNLNFEYPPRQVLKEVNFEIQPGSVTALVGPNGAGKTTLLRCMTSLETPLSGNVLFDGINVHDNPRAAHERMGYLSDFFGVYHNLSVRQNLTYMAWCHKLPQNTVKERINELAEEVDLVKYLDEKAGSLSRGYKQRLGVGLALVHNPKLLILDEPASGMDPEARIKFSELMIRLRNRGLTIIVSSHILAELEDYCTDMLVIRDGEIKSHVVLKTHQETEQVSLQIKAESLSDAQIKAIQSYEGVSSAALHDDMLVMDFVADKAKQSAFLKHLIEQGVSIYAFTPSQKTLKAFYMDLADKKEITKP